MSYKRILTIQDISCVGQCSMTVAMPILSACGHETCILPTAVLSTHTGGFGKPHIMHLGDGIRTFVNHWLENDIHFDAILTGYIGSVKALEEVFYIADALLAKDGLLLVDPAMADHGKLYSGLSEEYASKMAQLCARAHIMIPNITEAARFAGMDYREDYDRAYIENLLSVIAHPCVVMTGVGYTEGETGVAISENGSLHHISHKRIGRNFHGTGDMFAACFTGALLQEHSVAEAAQIASDFVLKSIEITSEEPAHWYGVRFESALPELIRKLQ